MVEPSPDERMQQMRARENELLAQGMGIHQASGIASREYRLGDWPEAWGNELEVFLFGDFNPPNADLVFEISG